MEIKNLDTSPKTEELAAAPKADAAPVKPGGIIFVTTPEGRKFGLKKLTPSQRYLLSKAIDLPNLSVTMQAMAVASVNSIDDEGFTPIKNEADLLERLDLIGDDGLEAITETVMSMYGVVTPSEVAIAKN